MSRGVRDDRHQSSQAKDDLTAPVTKFGGRWRARKRRRVVREVEVLGRQTELAALAHAETFATVLLVGMDVREIDEQGRGQRVADVDKDIVGPKVAVADAGLVKPDEGVEEEISVWDVNGGSNG